MVTVEEQHRWGLGSQRRGRGTSPATRLGSGRPIVRRPLEPFRRMRGALGLGLALWCAGLVSVAGAATITEFSLPTFNSFMTGITAGPDGALWFTEGSVSSDRIGRITTGPPPPPPAIPTLTAWGMVSLAGLLAGLMAQALRCRSAPTVKINQKAALGRRPSAYVIRPPRESKDQSNVPTFARLHGPILPDRFRTDAGGRQPMDITPP